jgi:hypothetical protein
MSSRAVARAIWIPAMLLCIGQGVIYYKRPPALFAPSAELKSFVTRDKTITLMRPSNWKGKVEPGQAIRTEVRFTPSLTAQFVVSHDLMGSLLADISRASSGSGMLTNIPGMEQAANAAQKTPLQAVHALQKTEVEVEFDAIKDGKEVPTQLAGLEAIRSDFTAEDGDLVGRRYSALTNEGRVSLFCACSKEETKYIMPAFEKMIKSLKIGAKGGM